MRASVASCCRASPATEYDSVDGDVAKATTCHGAHMEEVRSGHSEEPLEPHEPPTGGGVPWVGRIEELGGRYDTAVLGWVAPDGFPLAARLPVTTDPRGRRILLDQRPAGLPVAEGRACVTAHSHSP